MQFTKVLCEGGGSFGHRIAECGMRLIGSRVFKSTLAAIEEDLNSQQSAWALIHDIRKLIDRARKDMARATS